MKFNVGGFLEGLAAAEAGTAAGKAAAVQFIQRRQAQEFQQRLAGLRAAGDAWNDQQGRQVNTRNLAGRELVSLARMQGLDPKAREELIRQGMTYFDQAAVLGEVPNPYGPEAFQRFLQGTPYGKGLDVAPTPPVGPQRAPLTLPKGEGPLFRKPAAKAIVEPIRDAADRARIQGMADRYGSLQQLLVDLEAGKVTDAQAWESFRKLGPTPELEPLRKWSAGAGARIGGLLKGGAFTPQAREQALELQAALEEAASAFPVDPAALEPVRGRYLAFLRDPRNYRPDTQQFREVQEQTRKDEQETRLAQGAHQRNHAYLQGIANALRAGNTGQFRELVGQQRAFVAAQPAGYGLRVYGGEALDPTQRRKVARRVPGEGRTVTSPETDEEAAGRVLLEARRFVDGPEGVKALIQGARGELMRVFRPGRWEALPAAERRTLLEQLADLTQELGLPKVLSEGLYGRLTPFERALVENRTTARAEANRHVKERQALTGTVARKVEAGHLTPVQGNIVGLLVEDLDRLQGEAAELRRVHPEERTDDQRKRLEVLTRGSGVVERVRRAIRDLLNPGRRNWPAIPNKWSPAFQGARRQAVARYRERFGDPDRDTRRELYYLVEEGLLRP